MTDKLTDEDILMMADEYGANLCATDSKNEALLYGIKLEGLRHLAEILALARNQERHDELMAFRQQEVAAMETAAAAADKTAQRLHSNQVTGVTTPVEEPTKHVADRLHELVSYIHDQQHGNLQVARSYALDSAERSGFTQAASAYADAKDKLEEILNEGGI